MKAILSMLSGMLLLGFLMFYSVAYASVADIKCIEWKTQTCHIYLSATIESSDKYRDVIKTINLTDEDDTIIVHLAGKGGDGQTMQMLMGNFKNAKARVIMVVEGNVYSAHAFIALSGDDIIIRDNVFFMFHRSSLYKQEARCELYDGINDRGVNMKEKCLQYFKAILEQGRVTVESYLGGLLSEDELYNVLNGHDLYITGDDMKKRLLNASKTQK